LVYRVFFLSNSKLVFGSYLQWNGLVTISAVEHEVRGHAVWAIHAECRSRLD